MRAAGLEGRRKKRWRTTTIADPAADRARDLIQRDFAPRPGTDQRYAGDITYIIDLGRLGLPGDGHRLVQPPRGRLGLGRSHAHQPRRGCPGDGLHPAQPGGRA